MARHKVTSPITGSVWVHSVGVGQRVAAGTTLLVLESMKMEVPVETTVDGEVTWLAPGGQMLAPGDVVAIVDDSPAPARP